MRLFLGFRNDGIGLLCGSGHQQLWIVDNEHYRDFRPHPLDLAGDESRFGAIVVEVDNDGVDRFALKLLHSFEATA